MSGKTVCANSTFRAEPVLAVGCMLSVTDHIHLINMQLLIYA